MPRPPASAAIRIKRAAGGVATLAVMTRDTATLDPIAQRAVVRRKPLRAGDHARRRRRGGRRLALSPVADVRPRHRPRPDGLRARPPAERGRQGARGGRARHPRGRARLGLRLARGLHPRLPRPVRPHARRRTGARARHRPSPHGGPSHGRLDAHATRPATDRGPTSAAHRRPQRALRQHRQRRDSRAVAALHAASGPRARPGGPHRLRRDSQQRRRGTRRLPHRRRGEGLLAAARGLQPAADSGATLRGLHAHAITSRRSGAPGSRSGTRACPTPGSRPRAAPSSSATTSASTARPARARWRFWIPVKADAAVAPRFRS